VVALAPAAAGAADGDDRSPGGSALAGEAPDSLGGAFAS
jgi:hypothetical protein